MYNEYEAPKSDTPAVVGSPAKFKGVHPALIFGPMAGGAVLLLIGYVPFIISMVSSMGESNFENMNNIGSIMFMVLFVLLGFAAMAVGAVFYYIALYKAWSLIQDGSARTTPGKAVGFLFIPFFNFYWVFQATWGLSVDFNAYLDAKGYEVNKMTPGLFLTNCILPFACIIPILGAFAALGSVVFAIICVVQLTNGLNKLGALKAERAAAPAA